MDAVDGVLMYSPLKIIPVHKCLTVCSHVWPNADMSVGIKIRATFNERLDGGDLKNRFLMHRAFVIVENGFINMVHECCALIFKTRTVKKCMGQIAERTCTNGCPSLILPTSISPVHETMMTVTPFCRYMAPTTDDFFEL